MKVKYILVGTYKTKEESKGWYISKRYDVLWKKINARFDGGPYSSKNCYFNLDESIFGKIGNIKDFYFYDLKKFDPNLDGETKDKKVYKLRSDDFIHGIEKLIQETKSDQETIYRIGLQGNNLVGLFLNYLKNPERLSKVLLPTIAKDYRNQKYGLIKLYNNIQLYKIYNITQNRRSQKDLDEVFSTTWDEFLNINK